jgi:hypothetical protein
VLTFQVINKPLGPAAFTFASLGMIPDDRIEDQRTGRAWTYDGDESEPKSDLPARPASAPSAPPAPRASDSGEMRKQDGASAAATQPPMMELVIAQISRAVMCIDGRRRALGSSTSLPLPEYWSTGSMPSARINRVSKAT